MRLNFVSFNRVVTLGSLAQESWSYDTGLNGPGGGKTTVKERGDMGLEFTYEAGPISRVIVVPWSNIAHATWLRVADEKAKAK